MLNDTFRKRMEQMLGDEAAIFLQSLDTVAPVSVRMHPEKAASSKQTHHFASSGLEPVPWAPDSFYLQERPVFTLDPLLHAGAYYVQEASSMLLGHVVRAIEASLSAQSAQNSTIRTVLDACASPGGKTTLLASALPNSFIVANEVISSRLPALKENVIKWGSGNIAVTSSEVSRFSAMPGFFDLIVIDAPCSGEGLFRKQPDARLEWSAENARHCSLRQRRILMDAWPALRPGGCLIYSTCTFNSEENEQNLAWMSSQIGAGSVADTYSSAGSDLQADINGVASAGPGGDVATDAVKDSRTDADAVSGADIGANTSADSDSGQQVAPGDREASRPVESIPLELPDEWGVTEISKDGITGYVCYPHRVKGEGFFIAVIRKSVNASAPGTRGATVSQHQYDSARHDTVRPDETVRTGRIGGKRRSGRNPSIPFEHVPADISVRLSDWFSGGDHQFIRYGKMIHRIARSAMPFLEQLHLAMPVRYAGIEVAEAIRDDLKPAHAAALCMFLNHGHFQSHDLTDEHALSFLRSEALPPFRIGSAGYCKKHGNGWILARYKGLGLGWLKHVGNRMNNYYPRNWRIRMK